MRIDLDCVLWRTRGRNWDYTFVLRPAHPHSESWYDFHVSAFSGTISTSDPTTLGGVFVSVAAEEVPFVATTFQDASLKDAAGRPIAHYLVWFLSDATSELDVPPDWGARFVQAVGAEWTRAFDGDGASDDDLLANARSLLKAVTIADDERVRVQLVRRVVEKKKTRAKRRSSETNDLLLIAGAAGALLVALLLLLLTRC